MQVTPQAFGIFVGVGVGGGLHVFVVRSHTAHWFELLYWLPVQSASLVQVTPQAFGIFVGIGVGVGFFVGVGVGVVGFGVGIRVAVGFTVGVGVEVGSLRSVQRLPVFPQLPATSQHQIYPSPAQSQAYPALLSPGDDPGG